MDNENRYNSIGEWLRRELGRKTVKLSIDAGFTCPNRDGTCGWGGCAFCSGEGSGELASGIGGSSGPVSGSGSARTHDPSVKSSIGKSAGPDGSAADIGRDAWSSISCSGKTGTADGGEGIFAPSITEQIERMSAKWPDAAYLAYFQSHTNTYAPVRELRTKFYAALSDPRISGIVIATRPDCIGRDVLDLLSEINSEHFMWVELGLQTIHPATSEAMGIGYTLDVYDRAVRELNARGIRVVTHLILGLPGETEEMMLDSVRYVCRRDEGSRIFGIKLHLMNIVRTSRLAETMPDYVPFSSIDEYVDLVVRCLEIIPPEITVHRLTGDVPRSLLIAPEWSYRKRTILNAISHELTSRDTRQGAALTR